MPEGNITRAILTPEGEVLIEQPDGSYRPAKGETDWDRFLNMSEEEVEANAADDPHAMLTDEDEKGFRLVENPFLRKNVRVDDDILEWFRNQDPSYSERINAVLREYIERQRER